MNTNFKRSLKNREVLLGPLVTLATPEVAEILAKSGFDWLWLEMEHAPTDLAKIQAMIQAVGEDCACLVRVPWNDEVWIKRVLDLGCSGVVVPQIRSAVEAASAIAACKYPPEGTRSVGIGRAQEYGMNLLDYIKDANDQISVILQLEHVDAIRNLASILDTPGIDGVVIGPFDLSASMGMIGQVSHPEVQDAIGEIKAGCFERNIPVGIFAGDTKSAKAQIASGCTLIALGVDSMYLWRAAKQAICEINQKDS